MMTDNLGIIKTIAQGARRSKSPYFTFYEPGNILEIVVWKKETTNLPRILEASLIKNVFLFGKDHITYNQLLSLQIALEMYYQLYISEEESHLLYTLLQTFIEYLPSIKNNHLLVNWRLLIKLSEFLGFPILLRKGTRYVLSDTSIMKNVYDDYSINIISKWIDVLYSGINFTNSDNIIDKSAFIINRYIYDWFKTHLQKPIHHKAVELYEDYIVNNFHKKLLTI